MHKSVFISSTFLDMQLERDTLHTKIIPAVNREANKRGDTVSACDLRWGINTSGLEDGESSRKVLNVCLGEIDRCRPYMIVLLGYRYGWIPGRELISRAMTERPGFSLDDEEISVTALEVEYGALAHVEDPSRTLFYFREIDGPCGEAYQAEDAVHREKLDALKAKIQAIPGARVRTYHVDLQAAEQSMEAFYLMVYKDLYGLMRKEWDAEKGLDEYAVDQRRQWEYLEEKSTQFLAREVLLEEGRAVIREEGRDLLIHGAVGSGKSTLLSRLGKLLAQEGAEVIPLFCGYTGLTGTGFAILQYIVYELERRLGLPHFSEQKPEKPPADTDWLQRLQQLCTAYGGEGRKSLVFLIDGIDQLSPDEIGEKAAYLPAVASPQIRFVLSSVTAPQMPLERRLELSDLSRDERAQVVEGILRGRRRELSREVIDRIVRLPKASLPLYLSLVIQRLIMMDRNDFRKIADLGGGMDAIARYQLQLVDECPDSLEALSVYIMRHGANQVGGAAVQLMSYFLGLSRRGLRHMDLENLVNALRQQDGQRMQLDPTDAAAYIQYFGHFFFIRNDGRIDFTHKSFRQGILADLEDPVALHHLIASWLYQLPGADPVRTQELAWHLIQSDDSQNLADLLAREERNEALCSAIQRDLAACASADGGAWLRKSLRETAEDPSFLTYSGFVCNQVFYALPNDRKGLELRSSLAQTVLEMEEALSSHRKSHGYRWDISVNLERLSSIERGLGTEEHRQKAEEYAKRCLALRKELLRELEALDTPEKEKEFFRQGLSDMGKETVQDPAPQQIRAVISILRAETLRGICVAEELIANALSDAYPATAGEAIAYLEESLRVREALYRGREGNGQSFASPNADEEYELARIHLNTAAAYESLGTEDDLSSAEKHLLQAVQFSREAQEREPSAFHAVTLSQSLRSMSRFLLEHRPESRDRAFALADTCREAMEPLYTRSRDENVQLELSLVYHLLGDLWEARGNSAEAHAYFTRMKDLTKGLAQQTEDVAGKKAAVEAGLREAESAGALSPEEMKEHFREAYMQADELFRSFRNQESFLRLAEVYASLRRVIEGAEFGRETVGRRALIELRCASLDRGLEAEDVPPTHLKRCVVEYNALNEQLRELDLPKNAEWPREWAELLESVGIPREIFSAAPDQRSYDLSKKSLALAKRILSLEDNPDNRDAVAVSLSKLAASAMQADPGEFAALNRELLTMATELHRQTGQEKYAAMIFIAQMGLRMADGTVSEFLDGIRSDRKQADEQAGQRQALEQRLRALEQELAAAVGVKNALRRGRLKREIEALRQQLGRLR